MRYLKRYNESFDSREDVLEFCNNQLVSLLDSGYSITVMPIKVKEDDNLLEAYSISIQRKYDVRDLNGVNNRDYYFTFNDVRDEFTMFYEMLKNKYTIVDIHNADNETSGCAELVCESEEISLTEDDIYNDDYNCDEIINIYLNIKVK
jgi:hypothetical protein